MNRDYKEVFQDFYDELIEEGKSDDEAGEIALDKLADHYAALADDAHDRAKEHHTGRVSGQRNADEH